jgi:hypothetical protein
MQRFSAPGGHSLSLELRLHRYGNARSRTMSFVPTVTALARLTKSNKETSS